MTEIYIKNNRLITEKEWHNNISKLETKYENLIDNKHLAIRLIQRYLTEAIKKRATNNFAIFCLVPMSGSISGCFNSSTL